MLNGENKCAGRILTAVGLAAASTASSSASWPAGSVMSSRSWPLECQ